MPQRILTRQPPGSNDIDNLASFVEGFDARGYFDRQAEDAWRSAARRWPAVAAMLKLDPDSERRGSGARSLP